MGMYTQYRGWLCLDSINGENEPQAVAVLEQARANFKKREDLSRTWVSDDCWIHSGSNGSLWLFFGTEHKDYDDSMEAWIRHVVAVFPKAEGRIDVQYEEVYPGENTHCFLVKAGEIAKAPVKAWTEGYGLDFAYSTAVIPASLPAPAAGQEGVSDGRG